MLQTTSTAIHLLILIPPICSQIATKLKTTGLERKNGGRVKTRDSLFNVAADQWVMNLFSFWFWCERFFDVSDLNLMWAIWIWCERFEFDVSNLNLMWAICFCCDHFIIAVALVGHRNIKSPLAWSSCSLSLPAILNCTCTQSSMLNRWPICSRI